jgi:hypothetical protein
MALLRPGRAGPEVRRALQQQAAAGPAHLPRGRGRPGRAPGDDGRDRCAADHHLAPLQAVGTRRFGDGVDAGPGGGTDDR